MRTVKCNTNWLQDNKIGFIKDKEYPVDQFEKMIYKINGVKIKSEQGNYVWFYIGNKYFDMPVI
jgi:hypothetical protein